MVTLGTLARLAGSVYTDREREGVWSRSAEFGGASFRAVLWTAENGEGTGDAVLSVRGTQGFRDCVQDLRLLLGREPRAWRQGRSALIRARSILGGERVLYLTGHSLGGAYASALGAESGLPTITFNAPGMRSALLQAHRRSRTAPAWLATPAGRSVNVCLNADWIWRLSGPGLGVDLPIGPRGRGVAALPTGPAGVVAAIAGAGRTGANLVGFVRASIRRHALRALECSLRDQARELWDLEARVALRWAQNERPRGVDTERTRGLTRAATRLVPVS